MTLIFKSINNTAKHSIIFNFTKQLNISNMHMHITPLGNDLIKKNLFHGETLQSFLNNSMK